MKKPAGVYVNGNKVFSGKMNYNDNAPFMTDSFEQQKDRTQIWVNYIDILSCYNKVT